MNPFGRLLAFARRGSSTAVPPPTEAPQFPVTPEIMTAAYREQRRGRARRPTHGPSYQELVELAGSNPHAKACLAAVMAGDISTTQALVRLGKRVPRDRYKEMVSIWDRATEGERERFMHYVLDTWQEPPDELVMDGVEVRS
jgi:hypothetical protein